MSPSAPSPPEGGMRLLLPPGAGYPEIPGATPTPAPPCSTTGGAPAQKAASAAAPGGRRLVVLGVVYFTTATLVEVILEAASRRGGPSLRGGPALSGMEVSFILTCGEFAGCCVLALACGGRFSGKGDLEDEDDMAKLSPRSRALHNFYQMLPYVSLALLLCCGTGLANCSVAWVHYPVKVVMKSSKLIPAMVVSTVVGNSRKFSATEYVAALLVCIGTAAFMFHAGRSDAPAGMAALGVTFLLAAIVADVIIVNTQQFMMQKRGVPPMSLMLRQNFMGLVAACTFMCFTGDAPATLSRAVEQMVVLKYAACVGVVTGACVWANTYLVKEAGSVPQVALSTLRKLSTVVLSFALFPKPLTTLHLLAVAAVSCGLLLPTLASRSPGRRKSGSAAPRIVACTSQEPLEASQEPSEESPV
mmetsp:Transcript_74838/g.196269  ORF Transcript_74838/g.196269 Transcript_74838/m.196269 type:complete len:417 (-) Transcript_74838:74-1324(-)